MNPDFDIFVKHIKDELKTYCGFHERSLVENSAKLPSDPNNIWNNAKTHWHVGGRIYAVVECFKMIEEAERKLRNNPGNEIEKFWQYASAQAPQQSNESSAPEEGQAA